MKTIRELSLAGTALVLAQLACGSAYAETAGANSGCEPGDGNTFMSASPQTTANTEAQTRELAVKYAKAFQESFQLTPTQAAGIVGNLWWESDLNSGITEGTRTIGEVTNAAEAGDQKGYGIGQWRGERKSSYIKGAAEENLPASSQCASMNYFAYDLMLNPDFAPTVVNGVAAEKNLIGAVCAFQKLYVRPLNPLSYGRIQRAKDVMALLGETYVEGHGSATGDACDYYPGPQPDGSNASSGGASPPSGDALVPPNGYANDWNTTRFSNTTNEPITVQVVIGAGQAMPSGVDGSGKFTIPAGQYVDVTFALNTGPNFRSLKGDGSVWNQGEAFYEEKTHVIWFDMSYIYGANSNMRMICSDGQHNGYPGDLISGAPPAAKVGEWGIMAPFDRFHESDDPNNPNSAVAGPDGPQNAGGRYLYSMLKKGEGYVNRGRPKQVNDYDDASSLGCRGKMAVVF